MRGFKRPWRVRLAAFVEHRAARVAPQRWRGAVRRGAARLLPRPLAVLGMPKTGTTTLWASLHAQYGYGVTHAHRFDRLEWPAAGGKGRAVVVPVREPVGRAVSSFFWDRAVERRGDAGAWDVSAERLAEEFLERRGAADESETWFEDEVERTMGVDVYAAPFGARGWERRGGADGGYELLLVRVELADRDKLEALRGFTGRARLQLLNTNYAEDHAYGEAYRRFKAEARLPHSCLARLLEGRYARHFYGAEEREVVHRRWCGEHRD